MPTVSDLLRISGEDLLPQTPAATRPVAPEPAVPDRAEHQGLRKLLQDASRQVDAVGDLKQILGGLVVSLDDHLIAVDRERAAHASMQKEFSAMRSSHDAMNARLQLLESAAAGLEHDKENLRREMEAERQNSSELVAAKLGLAEELSALRAAMSVIVRQLGDEASQGRRLGEQNGLLSGQTDVAKKRIADLEEHLAKSSERVSALDQSQAALEEALEQSRRELSLRLGQLGETEKSLANAQARTRELESALAAAEADRASLAAAREDAVGRWQKETHALRLELDAVGSRLAVAEGSMAEARQTLASRDDELATTKAELLRSAISRNEADQKAQQLSATSETLQQQNSKLELEVARLTEHCASLTESLALFESKGAEKIRALNAQIDQHQIEAAKVRSQSELQGLEAATKAARIEHELTELGVAIEHERRERATAEAALGRARTEYARLQRQLVEERTTRRSDHQRRAVGYISPKSS